MGRWAMPMKHPITETVPLTFASETKIRCCGAVDSITMKELMERGWKCEICGRRIPARGDVLKLHGKRAMTRNGRHK